MKNTSTKKHCTCREKYKVKRCECLSKGMECITIFSEISNNKNVIKSKIEDWCQHHKLNIIK